MCIQARYAAIELFCVQWLFCLHSLITVFAVAIFTIFRAEIIPYKIALDLTEFLRQDHEYVPWESALDVMAYFDVVLGRSYVYGPYSVRTITLLPSYIATIY